MEAHFSLCLAYFARGDKKSALHEYNIVKELDQDEAEELSDLIGYPPTQVKKYKRKPLVKKRKNKEAGRKEKE